MSSRNSNTYRATSLVVCGLLGPKNEYTTRFWFANLTLRFFSGRGLWCCSCCSCIFWCCDNDDDDDPVRVNCSDGSYDDKSNFGSASENCWPEERREDVGDWSSGNLQTSNVCLGVVPERLFLPATAATAEREGGLTVSVSALLLSDLPACLSLCCAAVSRAVDPAKFAHSKHLQVSPQSAKPSKHSQYFFRQWDFLHVHPVDSPLYYIDPQKITRTHSH